MSDLSDIYQIKLALDASLAAALTAQGFAVVTRANQPENFQQVRPRLELKCKIGAVTGHRVVCPDGIVRYDCFRVTVGVQAITAPAVDGVNAEHEQFVGKVRAYFSSAANYSFADTTNFPNLFLAIPFKDSGVQDTLKTDEGVEYSTLAFDSIVQIRASAWPQP